MTLWWGLLKGQNISKAWCRILSDKYEKIYMVKYCVSREQINTSLIRPVFLGKKVPTQHTHTKQLNNYSAMDFTGVLASAEDFLIFKCVQYSAQLPYNILRWSSPSGTKYFSKFLALNSWILPCIKYHAKLLNIMLNWVWVTSSSRNRETKPKIKTPKMQTNAMKSWF